MSGNKIIRQRPVPAEAKAPVIWFFRSSRIQLRARDPAPRPQFTIKKCLNVDDRGLRHVHRSVSSDVFGIGVSRQAAHGIVAHVAEADRDATGSKFKSIPVLLERAMSGLNASLDWRCRIGPASLAQFVRVKAKKLFRIGLARVKELRASGIRLLQPFGSRKRSQVDYLQRIERRSRFWTTDDWADGFDRHDCRWRVCRSRFGGDRILNRPAGRLRRTPHSNLAHVRDDRQQISVCRPCQIAWSFCVPIDFRADRLHECSVASAPNPHCIFLRGRGDQRAVERVGHE